MRTLGSFRLLVGLALLVPGELVILAGVVVGVLLGVPGAVVLWSGLRRKTAAMGNGGRWNCPAPLQPYEGNHDPRQPVVWLSKGGVC